MTIYFLQIVICYGLAKSWKDLVSLYKVKPAKLMYSMNHSGIC